MIAFQEICARIFFLSYCSLINVLTMECVRLESICLRFYPCAATTTSIYSTSLITDEWELSYQDYYVWVRIATCDELDEFRQTNLFDLPVYSLIFLVFCFMLHRCSRSFSQRFWFLTGNFWHWYNHLQNITNSNIITDRLTKTHRTRWCFTNLWYTVIGRSSGSWMLIIDFRRLFSLNTSLTNQWW